MSEKPLLLSSAKSGVLLQPHESDRGWLIAMASIGLLVVIVGAADVTTRVAHALLGDNASFMSFAPAVALIDPSAFNFYSATSTGAVTAITPVRLQIPSISVDAKVEQVGKNATGAMGTPSNFTDVAWYSLGAKPGQAGNAVIDGHVNNALTTSGVFEHLGSLTLGDSVSVSDATGHTLNYNITDIEEYPANTAPADSIFATAGPSQLVLITCDGDWVSAEHQFDKRLVVFASLK